MTTAAGEAPRSARGGLLLAGGRSSRMGRPKALLRVGGIAMVAHVARALEDACDELVVVVAPGPDPSAFAGEDELRDALRATRFAARPGALRFARDSSPGRGPVAGLAAGLSESRADLVLVAPCDLPFLSPTLVAGLFDLAGGPSSPDVVAARRGGFWEPMPVVLRRATTALVYVDRLARGDLRPTAPWRELRVVAVEGEALSLLDPGDASFLGVNDPAELARAQARFDAARGVTRR